ncbi:hypothetical protein NU688_07510 [Variovorax sp. ZS18.2.2]|uniref:hypothetical protein n=1 Tax=Variovorax sp. ZS18.2.2 TaxID=2971255 RepID=UPI002151C8E2|nr:hypothetical protein [Variovorax sp. ZS18.2.2]MCR6475998.1 hypothetical protein [Variovorax sp. ZS18.2.2]
MPQSPDAGGSQGSQPDPSGDGLVLSMDPARLQTLPHGNMSSALKGILLFLGLMMLGIAAWFCRMLAEAFRQGTADTAFVLIMSVSIFVFALIAVAALVQAVTAPYAFPTLFNRLTGKVAQLRGGERIEADWSQLVPQVEVAMSGGAQLCHLCLTGPAEAGGGKMIVVSNANNSPADCLAHYEFLCRYMAGDWRSLPEVECLEGARRPLLREFSDNLWTQMTNYRPWDERSAQGKALSSAALLTIALLWWPMLLLTLIGSRLGRLPRFSDADLGASPALLEGSVQEPFMRIRLVPALGAAEQAVYVSIAALSTAVWCWPGAGVLARIADMVRAL